MRNWGTVVTVFYALAVIGIGWPGAVYLGGNPDWWRDAWPAPWEIWSWLGVLIAGQGLLFFLSVDTSWRRLRPRQHVLVSVATAAILFAFLTCAGLISLDAAFHAGTGLIDSDRKILALLLGGWGFWGILFYLYFRGASDVVERLVSWLLRGSVLELLVVVPCHVLVRQRGDCSAPIATGMGVVTGAAIMLLCFGPSVVFLYLKRLKAYGQKRSGEG